MRKTGPDGRRGRPTTTVARAALTIILAIGAAGCGGTADPPGAPSTTAAADGVAATLTVRDAWVKAADSGMTAAFAVLVNDADTDVTVVSAVSPVSPIELHEMTMKDGAMVMRPTADGFTIRARSSHTLEPGGDHLMLMDLSTPIRPGDEIPITLTLADGGTVTFTAVAKPFAGAGESYAPDTHDHPTR
jgi:hypothetical protein